jgi:polyhydroxyalkanoate synthase
MPSLPDLTQVPTMLGNAWAVTFGDGIEPREQTPSVLVADGDHRTVRQYSHPDGPSGDSKVPTLLVPPLAVPGTCYDLRPCQSLARHLMEQGRRTYLVDYGTIGFADRKMGLETWIDEILPHAIEKTLEHSGADEVDLVAWSLGGTLSLLTTAAHPNLPIRSVSALATPIDYSKIPSILPFRALGQVTGGAVVTNANRLVGGFPSTLVRASFRATAIQREVTKPLFIARNLLHTERLARMETIDRFMADMPAYPGRLYGQIYGRLIINNDLAKGRLKLTGRTVELSEVKVPVFSVGSKKDAIAPFACVKAVTKVLPNAPHVRFEQVPGSHLGLVSGPEARHTTWRHLVDFLTNLDDAS